MLSGKKQKKERSKERKDGGKKTSEKGCAGASREECVIEEKFLVGEGGSFFALLLRRTLCPYRAQDHNRASSIRGRHGTSSTASGHRALFARLPIFDAVMLANAPWT